MSVLRTVPTPRPASSRRARLRLLLSTLVAAMLVLGVLPGAALAAPVAAPATIDRAIPGRYVVVLRDVGAAEVSSTALKLVAPLGGQIGHVYRSALRGFSARLSAAAAAELAKDPSVASVTQDGLVRATATQATPPSWGLDRVDQRRLPLSGTYRYDSTGVHVNAYVIDTGIDAGHSDFGGRAAAAFDAVGDGRGGHDCNGHGTHVAGTVGGSGHGIAKNVRLHGVRVLGCDGFGQWSWVIAGVDWVTANHVKPAVANMSLGGGAFAPLDTAVANSIAAGVTYTVAAGNDGVDAANTSPARIPAALTVGATTGTDARAGFSNFGSVVDLFAPGELITSAWIGGGSATATISGTSMAAPHVAGVAARYLQTNPTATPATVAARLVGDATAGAVGNPGAGSPNRLLFAPMGAPTCLGAVVTIMGTAGDDVLAGTAAADVIAGLGGDDVLSGLGGNDRICGGDGDDTIDGGAGHDRIDGDSGDDALTGNAGDDRIRGGAGNDRLHGLNGKDRLVGGSGADLLTGGAGDDRLEIRDGIGGNDTAHGQQGRDLCRSDRGDVVTSCP